MTSYFNIRGKSLCHTGCRVLWLTVCWFSLVACNVTPVSRYDETTDLAVTQLHKDFESFLITLETEAGLTECSYDNHAAFYQMLNVEVRSIQIRANAIPDNALTIEQIDLLADSLQKMAQLHQIRCLDPGIIASLRSSFDSHITAILKFELGKKRGAEQ